jgi:hypothetical protein
MNVRFQKTNSLSFAAVFLLLSPIVVACFKTPTGLPVWIARHEDCGADDRRVVVAVVLPHGRLKLNVEDEGIDSSSHYFTPLHPVYAERVNAAFGVSVACALAMSAWAQRSGGPISRFQDCPI